MFRVPSQIGRHLRDAGTLLVPTHQRMRAVQLAWAAEQLAAGARVWGSPDVLTPAGWARRESLALAALCPAQWPRILGAAEEWVLWREAAAHAARELVFLDPGSLGESLKDASELAPDHGITPAPARPDSESGLLYAARQQFEARCRELHAAPVSALITRLAERAATRPPLFAGFDTVPPRLLGLASAGAAAQAPALAAGHARRMADADAELEAIARWCRDRLEARADARLLVMLPGAGGARERLAALIAGALDPGAQLAGAARALVGLEGGEPFATLPLPAQALHGLTVLCGAQVEFESLCAWLTAPYWGSPAACARAALTLALRERGFASLALRDFLGALQLIERDLAPHARELAARLRRAAGLLGEGRASPRRWSERFEAALAALSWPGVLPAGSGVHQARLRWRELLEEFGELAPCVGALGCEAALELLRSLAQHTPYRPADEDVPVTVSPMLADPVVEYDGVWVAGLSADVLPQPVAPNPYLPLAAQAAAGIAAATSAGRRAQAQRLLASWRAASGELVLSVPAREQDLELLPSPLIGALTEEPAAPGTVWLPARLGRAGCTQVLEDARGPSWNPLTPVPSGTRALSLQSECAFRAFAELRLGATPSERAEPGIRSDQRGVLLHLALQALWDRLHDSATLGALGEEALQALIAQCVMQAAGVLQAEVRGRGRRRARRAPDGQLDMFAALPPALERECRRARALIRRLCALELTRAPFTVAATEHPLDLQLGGGRMRMRVDRIDQVPEGRLVLDYKSGKPGSSDWYGERPSHPQLIAYLVGLGGDVVALATVNLTARAVRFAGVAATAGLIPKVKALGAERAGWQAQQQAWRALIERLIRAFLEGDARVDPAPGACEHCHLGDLCRIGAHRAPEPEPHAEGSDG